MRPVVRTAFRARVLAALIAGTLALSSAAAQTAGDRPPGPVWYAGTVRAAGEGTKPVQLHLTLYPDGFAFGRLQLPGRGLELLGPGHLQDGVDLRLALAELQPGEDPWWAAELAHLAATTPASRAETPLRDTVAVLKATRDLDFADEGRQLTGTFRWSTGEPLEFAVERVATSAMWSLEQGRISSSAVLPYFTAHAELSQWFERDALPAWRSFVAEGRDLSIAGVIGWGWYREERVQVAGAAGDLISVLSTVDTYTGGAHPNTFHHSYLLQAGRTGVARLDLADLFGRQTRWLARLSDLVIEGLRRQQATWVVDGQVARLHEDDLAVFTLTAQGVTFHFSPYLMGPYVQGTFRVTLPFEALLDLATPDSPLATFAAGTPFAVAPAFP